MIELTSFSKKPARSAIWFSFIRRASRDRLAAMLFFRRRAQYLSSFISSGTNCLRDFLIIGCGFNSSSENARVRGSKSRDEDIENAVTSKTNNYYLEGGIFSNYKKTTRNFRKTKRIKRSDFSSAYKISNFQRFFFKF